MKKSEYNRNGESDKTPQSQHQGQESQRIVQQNNREHYQQQYQLQHQQQHQLTSVSRSQHHRPTSNHTTNHVFLHGSSSSAPISQILPRTDSNILPNVHSHTLPFDILSSSTYTLPTNISFSRRFLPYSSPLHTNLRHNEPIYIATNQPSPAPASASIPFQISNARAINHPIPNSLLPFILHEQQSSSHRISVPFSDDSYRPDPNQQLPPTNMNVFQLNPLQYGNQSVIANHQDANLQQDQTSNNSMFGSISLPSRWSSPINGRVQSATISSNVGKQAEADEDHKPHPKIDNNSSTDNASANEDVLLSSRDSNIHQDRELFPFLLYRILMDAESHGFSEIISFLPHGRAFAVHSRFMFVEVVMPIYFSHSSFRSFRRYGNVMLLSKINFQILRHDKYNMYIYSSNMQTTEPI